MYISRREIKTFELILCSTSTLSVRIKYIYIYIYIHTHPWATKYKLCNFGESAYELHALTFAFKAGVAQCKNEW